MVKYNVLDVIQFMTNDDLRIYKKVGSSAPLHKVVAAEKEQQGKKGIVFVSPTKEHLIQGKGYIVTSYETLHKQYNEVTHWTPNTFRGGTYYDFKERVIKGHTRDNLKQINVIGFDIDTKNVDLYALFSGCDEVGLPRPNLVLETPRGYQFFIVLETPFYVSIKGDYKSLRVADRLATNMIDALQDYAAIDDNCSPFGFYRMPNDHNIRYFERTPACTSDLIAWSIKHDKQRKKNMFQVIDTDGSIQDQTKSDWYKALIRSKEIDKGYYAAGRNNALLTLAIANYQSGIAFNDAYDELDIFNTNLFRPLSKREFDRTIKSAYSGRYKGVKRSYVEGLLQNWIDDESVQFRGREGWYKFAKPREERVRSHLHEREDDIIKHLSEHTSPGNPLMHGSIRELAEIFGMATSTLQSVLKKTKRIYKRTVGRGRGAITMIASKSMLIKHLLLQKDIENDVQTSFSIDRLDDKLQEGYSIPSIRELLTAHDLALIEDLARGSPRGDPTDNIAI